MNERLLESEFGPNDSDELKDTQADQTNDRPGQLRAILPIWEAFEEDEIEPTSTETQPLDPKIAEIADGLLDDLLMGENAKLPDETWFS